MNYIKSPVNWVGNKFKYLGLCNNLVKGKKYSKVIDLFMGSGNLIINIDCEANKYIGNDKNKLVPKLYGEVVKHQYSLNELEIILNQFNRFSKKEDYYVFRDYWNKKYLSDNFDKNFVYETILLLKMCSNSMVRFNPTEGYFNQGFRGLGNKTEFFANEMKNICVDGLNQLAEALKSRQYKFTNTDFLPHVDKFLEPDNLLILDPPYILRADMYDTDFSQKHDIALLDIIQNTKSDFIYFNYLYRDGKVNEQLNNLINTNNFNVIEINNKTLAGQGRSENIKEVNEVIVTNVRM